MKESSFKRMIRKKKNLVKVLEQNSLVLHNKLHQLVMIIELISSVLPLS